MTTILNDIHIGFNRVGGTTPSSREALRQALFDSVKDCLNHADGHVIIAGDLFDDFEVDGRDWLATYLMFSEWLDADDSRYLTLVAGNHDHSPRGSKVSSFEMLCAALQGSFAGNVKVVPIDEHAYLTDCDTWVVAHCSNQDVFESVLDIILGEGREDEAVIVHANLHNNFAVESDHSLNVSEEYALRFVKAGLHLVFAHEHQARTFIPHGTPSGAIGTVTVLGNQFPTSIADCLGNADKFMHRIDGGVYEEHQTWGELHPEFGFHKVLWTELADHANTRGFIRVQGEATMTQAAEVVQAIASFRQKSPAFIVANAVKVEGIADLDALPAEFEAAKAFDVLAFIKQNLTPEEWAVVEKLNAD